MAMRVQSNGGFDRYRERVVRESSSLISEYAAKIDTEAKRRAPVRFGTLRRAISHWMVNPLKAIIGVRGVPYARIQDLGGQTSNQYGPNRGYIKPKLYLTGAFESLIPEFRQKLRRILRP